MFKSVLSLECECLRLPYSNGWVSGHLIGLVSKILLISSKAGGKVLLINVGIEVCGTIPDGFAIKNKNFEQISC